tara:strand:- start:13201 stop:13881 length:681 start_codon:yes stop_codon:yes gene_type:complete
MPAQKKNKSVFDNLFSINANEYKEQKGKFDYLSWSDALSLVLKEYPETTWEVHEFDFPMLRSDNAFEGVSTRQPYMKTEAGCFVKVSVTIDGITRTEILAVMNNYNKTIENPTATDINNSIKRCLVKCFALFGLALYIYQGEDLPEEDKPKPITDAQYKEIMNLIENKDAKYKQQVAQGIKQMKLNSSNFDEYLKMFKKATKEEENSKEKNIELQNKDYNDSVKEK